ncbi:MAG: glycosyltransferase [Thermodesulfovibrionales bacterium]
MSEGKIENLVSVAAIIRNDSEIIDSYIKETIDILKKSFTNYELVLIDNGSTDDSVSKIKKMQLSIENIRLIILSRQYHDEIAYTAALEQCIGDFVVLMDINTDPPSLIPELVKNCIEGHETVVAERSDRKYDSFIEKLFSQGFYKISRLLTGYNVNPKLGNFFAFSRRSVNSIVNIKDKNRYLKYLIHEVGYSHNKISYNKIKRLDGRRKGSFLELFAFAVEIIVSNSNRLIRIASLIGLLAGLLNLIYIFYAVIYYIVATFLLGKKIVPGWTTTAVVNSVMFFLIFLILAIFSEYLTRILRETKGGNLYFIREELNSCVFPKNVDRKNVV